ncbi:SEL1-like repeat protein [Dyella caseinilytica]|nr:DUF6396 domain-containing protein [Dyella caseinilytica]GFZ91170.1 hypothetical protein GCM10011408_07990 [Dyella caseinilytica]
MPHSSDFAAVKAKLAFTCTHEAGHLPSLNPDADQLFKYARYLEKANGPKNFNDIARYYRIAAAYGHYKANHNLQLLVSEGDADSPNRSKETIDLVQQLIKGGIPGGYYDMAYYLEQGYGVKQDQELAWLYYRKAADLGSPNAQFHVGKLLIPSDNAPDVAKQMWRCAAEQGYGEAASQLGIYMRGDKLYRDATNIFQLGAASGASISASYLEYGFKSPPLSDSLNYLALPADPERSRRYKAIGNFLDANDGRDPKVPDIDKIAPLPPAPLPEWDGTFQWQKEQEQIPPKPSDELIQRMAKGKNLDPATGLPIPPPPKTALGTRVKTGERCPESGDWCVWLTPTYRVAYFQRSLRKGDIMPTYMLSKPRRFGLLGDIFGMRYDFVAVEWGLMRYADTTS